MFLITGRYSNFGRDKGSSGASAAIEKTMRDNTTGFGESDTWFDNDNLDKDFKSLSWKKGIPTPTPDFQ